MSYKFNFHTGKLDNIGSNAAASGTYTGTLFKITSDLTIAEFYEYSIRCNNLTIESDVTLVGCLCLQEIKNGWKNYNY